MTQPSSKRRFLTIALASIGAFAVAPLGAQPASRIRLEQLEAMFANMRAQTKWNIDGPLLWGYFFFDPSVEKLQRAASLLAATGYTVVGISPVSQRGTFRLHVEKVELHTPASLHARNTEFYALAGELQIASYDGMDVGPSPPSK